MTSIKIEKLDAFFILYYCNFYSYVFQQANRDVTRMEIFISLVRLLEQSSKTGVAQQPNGESLMMAHQQFHQLASLPGGSIS